MAANKKPSNRKPLPDPLAFKETRRETRTRIAEQRAAASERIARQKAQEHRTRMQEQRQFVDRNWYNYKSAGAGAKTYNEWKRAAQNEAAKDFQTQIGKRKIDIVRTRDTLSGRTVEAGTRSLREGMRSWMRDLRGGGGSRLTGR